MKFILCSNFFEINRTNCNTVYLVKDNWNDWFTYCTMFSLEYIDNVGTRYSVGSVKIGEIGMNEENSAPNVPKEFERLEQHFFSVGQSSEYYKTLSSISPIIANEILEALNDIALCEKSLNIALKEHVTRSSLLRDISLNMVKDQFKRLAHGGAELTDYTFNYIAPQPDNLEVIPYELSFQVNTNSFPPTNIHVIIGRNGVGKTHLIRNMISCVLTPENKDVGCFNSVDTNFANLIFISFSAFDEVIRIKESLEDKSVDIPFTYVGLSDYVTNSNNSIVQKSPDILNDEFVLSLKKCLFGWRGKLWIDAITTLESDPVFRNSEIKVLSEQADELKTLQNKYSKEELRTLIFEFEEKAKIIFSKLSSGHKIIILTITRLVETVEEKTLVFLDEPEGHLHPPLLSAFIRALSNLMTNRNGVAIIATHSPVILQEVPKSCVWKLKRNVTYVNAERLRRESFGENIGILTSEIFGLEVTKSGFHTLINEVIDKCDTYDEVLEYFNNELGFEARSIIRGLMAIKDEER